jgi:predicted metal-dependent peptidase
MKSSDKLAAARARACKMAPYFRTGILTLIPQEQTGLNTLAVTENGIMLWDPSFVDSLPQEQLAAVVIHEWLHIMYKHAPRQKAIGADHELWNIAADCAINDSIGALPLPPDCVTPQTEKMPSGLTAEAYYRELIKRKEQEQQKKQQNNAPQQNAQNNNNSGQSEQKQSGGNSENNNNQNGQSQSSKQQSGQQSQSQQSGQSGTQQSGQSQSGQPSQDGQGGENAASKDHAKKHKCGGCAGNPHAIEKDIISKEQGRTQTEMTRAVKQVAEAIRKEASKGIGNIGAGLAVWADQVLAPPRVNWRARLTQLVRDSIAHKAGAVTHRYTKPSRRQAGLGYGAGRATLPALISPIPRIAVAVDTSGSMGTDEINKAMAEINGILKAIGAPVDFVSFDTVAGKVAKINNVSEARKNLTGGGGTDFRPVLTQLGKAKPRYDAVIVVTDGGGYAPQLAPSFKVIWALVGRYKTTPIANGAPVKWGVTVNIDD